MIRLLASYAIANTPQLTKSCLPFTYHKLYNIRFQFSPLLRSFQNPLFFFLLLLLRTNDMCIVYSFTFFLIRFYCQYLYTLYIINLKYRTMKVVKKYHQIFCDAISSHVAVLAVCLSVFVFFFGLDFKCFVFV